jgi:hypothetical protein
MMNGVVLCWSARNKPVGQRVGGFAQVVVDIRGGGLRRWSVETVDSYLDEELEGLPVSFVTW